MVKSQRPKRQSAQSANRFVGKYLDVKRVHLPRTDDHAVAQNYVVVSEVPDEESASGAVNYHKVELTSRETRPDTDNRFRPWRGGRYEETSNVVVD